MVGWIFRFTTTFVAVLLLQATAQAQITIQHVQATDVTPSGFAVIWQTSEPAMPDISVYSDPGGMNEMTPELEVWIFPLRGGDPQIIQEYNQDEAKDSLRSLSKSLGLMKIRVHGCSPNTTYYYRVFADNGFGETAFWPENDPAPVTTALENTFINQSKQLLITLTNNDGTLEAKGWFVTASSGEALYPLSAVVGDGAADNQAFLNLSHLFGLDGRNWAPAETRQVRLAVYGAGVDPVHKELLVIFSDQFHVSDVDVSAFNVDLAGPIGLGDINGDRNVDLQDAILALQIMVGIHPISVVYKDADVNDDGKIGLGEANYVLQYVSGLR
jgi:hypothetical protein